MQEHRGVMELEAEAACFLFFAAHNIEIGTASFSYLDSWAKSADEIMAVAEHASEGATSMLESIYGKEQELDASLGQAVSL